MLRKFLLIALLIGGVYWLWSTYGFERIHDVVQVVPVAADRAAIDRLMTTYTGAWESGSVEDLARVFSDNPSLETQSGHQTLGQFEEIFSTYRDTHSDRKSTLSNLTIDGKQIAFVETLVGIEKKSGQKDSRISAVFATIENDHIVSWKEITQ